MPITLERTPIEKQMYIRAMLDCGASVNSLSRQLDVSNHTVIAVKRSNDLNDRRYEAFKKYMPMQWGGLAMDTLALCDRAEIKKAPIQTKVWIAGVATDKMQALEGTNRPVFNVFNVVADLTSRMESIRGMTKALDTTASSTNEI